MKHIVTIVFALLLFTSARSQSYSFTFRLEGVEDSVLYIGRHYRDQLQLVDSAQHTGKGEYRFKGRRSWNRGLYALVRQDKKGKIGDFAIDDSRNFTLTADAKLSPASVKVKGSRVNSQMFTYMTTLQAAQKEQRALQERKKDPAQKAAAEAEEKALNERMVGYQQEAMHPKTPNIFFELVNLCDNPDVPDSVEDKAGHFRTHYWDGLFEGDWRTKREELLYSPQLFNKMNYFFFGLLYHADADIIITELDRLMGQIGDDTALQRYVMEFIEPRYFRSTKNIGWDAVWCHIAKEYILKGRCPWMKESEVYLARQNYNRISQSIIGAHGQELWMADTNQSDNPDNWISSHRFPTRYVILWFWDPDCHHCQEQSAELKVLYDSLQTAPDRRFEVYAVGYESDVAKWKRYVREHDFRWVNVGGTNVNIDYQEAYNVHGAPTMIILNERRDIIMNKVLPVKSILPFLDSYEKRVKSLN